MRAPDLTGSTRAAVSWLLDDDTGSSSLAIWSHMMGLLRPADHPWDPSDFGRCVRLLAQPWASTWRARLPEMAAKSPEWAALVKDWPRLEAIYDLEVASSTGRAPKLYARMKKLLETASKTRATP